MPITGPASYLPTCDAFVSHWGEVNTALGAGQELVMADGASAGDLLALRDSLETARDAVADAGISRSLAREQVTELLTALQSRLVEFNDRVRADFPGSIYERVLPAAFQVSGAEGLAREALRQVRALWVRINDITPTPPGVTLPYTLRSAYTLATFSDDIGALRAAYLALSDSDQALRLAREQRNDLQDAIYPILKNYRLKVPTTFPLGNALVDSLPALTPVPGSTPAAVTAHVTWETGSSQAKVTWVASSEADLEKYEVRGVPGASYNTDDESVLATVLPGAAQEFLTDFGLTAAGLTTGFKVYVVLNTGNEKGSEPVYVTRPG